MKVAVYIEDGVKQLILTPTDETEKGFVKMFAGEGVTAEVFAGSFYECAGGWVRGGIQPLVQHGQFGAKVVDSLMLVVREKEKKET